MVMYAGSVVEAGDVETVIRHPAHPYTRLLIDAAPDPGRFVRRPAAGESSIDSRGIRRALTPRQGCLFRSRCPHAMPHCRTRTAAAFRHRRRSSTGPHAGSTTQPIRWPSTP